MPVARGRRNLLRGRYSLSDCTSANRALSRYRASSGEGNVAEALVAEILRENLTEYRLVRILARENIMFEGLKLLGAS